MWSGEISVYGGFPARIGLSTVRDVLAAGFPAADVTIVDLGPGLGPHMHFKIEGVFFATLHVPDEDVFLFDGGVKGSLDEAITFVRQLSECFSAAGLEHDFHVERRPMEYAASFEYHVNKTEQC
jgi:hypothetical protein